MQPYHALKLAEHNEERAAEFFERFAMAKLPAQVRAAALEMAADEREHVRLIREWLVKFPEPAAGWDEDPDPPAVAD
jgi:rubrerythrin